jgi:hypothetical protein
MTDLRDMKPTTLTGRGLAAFLHGLLPEDNGLTWQIAEAERQAIDAYLASEDARRELAAALLNVLGSSPDETTDGGVLLAGSMARALLQALKDLRRGS